MTDLTVVRPFAASESTSQSEIDRINQALGTNKQNELPPQPSQLSDMPHGLHLLQEFIYNRMTYPIPELAGFMALGVLGAFLQQKVTIKSLQGLGFHNWLLVLLGTGYGKDALREPFFQLSREAIHGGIGTALHSSQANSKQGLHLLLEENNSIFLFADEFANWVARAEDGGHMAETLFYAMEGYGRTFGLIEPGKVQHRKYEPVQSPRLSILATSTPDLMFDNMNRKKAAAGAWNRWMMFIGDEQLPKKRYSGFVWKPEEELLEFLRWAHELQDPAERESLITFNADGWKRFEAMDQELAEPIKQEDNLLGGRFAEQAIKVMGLWAVANKSTEIGPEEVEAGFAIRHGLYLRAKAAADEAGALDEGSDTSRVFESIRKYVSTKGPLLESQMRQLCTRKWEKLELHQRNQVLMSLKTVGIDHDYTSKSNLRFFKREVISE